MWILRGLSGPAAGQTFELNGGRNLVGRAPHCQVRIPSPSISKEHAEILVYPNRIVLNDLGSSNGSYVRGVKIQTSEITAGDKIAFHDQIFEIQFEVPQDRVQKKPLPKRKPNAVPPKAPPPQAPPVYHTPPPVAEGNASVAGDPHATLQDRVNQLIEVNLMPPFVKLAKHIEFKWLILSFILVYIFSTTFLSMIPMAVISQESITVESKRRAGSIARSIATINQTAILQGNLSALNINAAEAEEGVTDVYIIQASDGMVLAPASRAGSYLDKAFVHTARREMRALTADVDVRTVGASFPMGGFDPNTGEQSVKAYAVVLYDVGTLAFDNGKYLSLFFQTLIISCLVGYVIFYIMYKLIEDPIKKLNSQLDEALRTKNEHLESEYRFLALQALAGNISSLLTRYIHGEGQGAVVTGSKDQEAFHLSQMMTVPCLVISEDGKILAMNQDFASLVHGDPTSFVGQGLHQLPDPALVQNVTGLCQGVKTNQSMQQDTLEFSGNAYSIRCAGVYTGNEVSYYIVTLSAVSGEAAA